jgi:uncharacterized protein YjbJ (UPF0337 family)
MTVDEKERGIDRDRTEGSIKQMGGGLKKAAGEVLGDEKLKREGQSEKGAGKLQNAWGSAKDTIRDATDGRNDP